MKIENEITVLVKSDYSTIKNILEQNNFTIKEEYDLLDIYLVNSNLDLSKLSNLEILSKCVLIRDIIGIEKELLYKYKKYDENENIIEQGKVKCPITDTEKALKFMETIDYKKIFQIYDKCIVFSNEDIDLIVQLVNDEYIFIEIETNNKYTNAEELKEIINKHNLPIDKTNYFVKKAEIMLKKVLKR